MVLGCYLCNKPFCEISSLLDIPWSTVSGIIGNMQAFRNSSNSAMKQKTMISHRAGSLSAEAHGAQKSPMLCWFYSQRDLLTLIAAQKCEARASWNGFPWLSSCMQASHHQVQCNRGMEWCKARCHWTPETCFVNFSVWQSDGWVCVWRMLGERYLPDCTVPTLKFGGGGIMVWCSFMPLTSSEQSEILMIQLTKTFWTMLTSLCEQLGKAFSIPSWLFPSVLSKIWLDEFGVDELDWAHWPTWSQTPLDIFGMKWNGDCGLGLLVLHQCFTSQMLYWKNLQEFLQIHCKILWKAFTEEFNILKLQKGNQFHINVFVFRMQCPCCCNDQVSHTFVDIVSSK